MHYDARVVGAHLAAADGQPVPLLLVNEAPGPQEARQGMALVGPQGGVFYRTLCSAGVNWVTTWAALHPGFGWPVKGLAEYAHPTPELAARLAAKEDFLALRARHVCCTNSYPRWPKSAPEAQDFVDPRPEDVVSAENLARLRAEAAAARASVLLIGGVWAYLACTGVPLQKPATREATRLTAAEHESVEARLGCRFAQAWYMGHTRRWSGRPAEVQAAFALIRDELGW